jgi:hypothetical protein
MFLWKLSIPLQDYTVLQPWKPEYESSKYSWPWHHLSEDWSASHTSHVMWGQTYLDLFDKGQKEKVELIDLNWDGR